MSVVVMLTLKAAEGRYDQLAETIQAILPDTVARPGAMLIRAAGNPATGTVTLYEEWDRIESQQAYMAWRADRGDIATLASLLREPPQVAQLTSLF
jgi:quinol monooxygenase YgiN